MSDQDATFGNSYLLAGVVMPSGYCHECPAGQDEKLSTIWFADFASSSIMAINTEF